MRETNDDNEIQSKYTLSQDYFRRFLRSFFYYLKDIYQEYIKICYISSQCYILLEVLECPFQCFLFKLIILPSFHVNTILFVFII